MNAALTDPSRNVEVGGNYGTSWHPGSLQHAFTLAAGNPKGLSSAEARRRLTAHGRNELRETKGIRPLHIFFQQFDSLLVWILAAASVIAGVFGDRLDCGAILAILLLNALVGFYQELSAEKSIAALKRMTA